MIEHLPVSVVAQINASIGEAVDDLYKAVGSAKDRDRVVEAIERIDMLGAMFSGFALGCRELLAKFPPVPKEGIKTYDA